MKYLMSTLILAGLFYCGWNIFSSEVENKNDGNKLIKREGNLLVSFDDNDEIYQKDTLKEKNNCINYIVNGNYSRCSEFPIGISEEKYKDLSMKKRKGVIFLELNENKIQFNFNYPENAYILDSYWDGNYVIKTDMGYFLDDNICYNYLLMNKNITKEISYCHRNSIFEFGRGNYVGFNHIGPKIIKYKKGYIVYDKDYKISNYRDANSKIFLLNDDLSFSGNINYRIEGNLSGYMYGMDYDDLTFEVSKSGCSLILNNAESAELINFC